MRNIIFGISGKKYILKEKIIEETDPRVEQVLSPIIQFLKSLQTSTEYNYSIATDVDQAIRSLEKVIKRSKKIKHKPNEIFASEE